MSDAKKMQQNLDSAEAQKEREKALQKAKTATEVSNAYKEGRLPTTAQVTQTIDRIEKSDTLHDASKGMSPTGKSTMASAERVMSTMRDYVAEKNDGDHLQQAILHSQRAAEEIKKLNIPEKIQSTTTSTTAPDNNASTLELSKQATDHAIQIGKLLFTSEEYRDLLRELYFVLRDVFARAAPGDTSAIRKNIDQAAYYTQQAAGSNQPVVGESDLRAQEQHPDETEQRHRNAELARQARETDDVSGAAQQTIPPRDEFKENLKQAAVNTIDQEGSNIPRPADAKTFGKDIREKTQHTLANIEFTEEETHRLADRFRRLLRQLEQNPSYRQSMSDLLALITTLSQRHVDLAQATHSHVKEAAAAKEVVEARRHTILLFEQLAGGQSLQPLFSNLRELWTRVKSDDRARQYLGELRRFLENCLQEPTYLDRQENKGKIDTFINEGQEILVDPYRSMLNSISDEIGHYLQAVIEDKSNQRLAKDIEQLFSNAMLDGDGKLTIKPELARDLALLTRRVFRSLRFMPLPRVEQHDEVMDLTLDNIVLYCGELLPDQITVRTETNISMEGKESGKNLHNTVHLTIDKIRGEVRDMLFDYNRKKFPAVHDSGLLSASFMKEQGMRLEIVFVTPQESDPEQTVKVSRVTAGLKNLKIKFKDTGHDALYTIISPVVNNMARREVERAVGDSIRSFFRTVDNQLGKTTTKLQKTRLGTDDNEKDVRQHEKAPTADTGAHGRREVQA